MRLAENTALILIDIQQGFDDLYYWGGGRNNPQAEEVAASLLGLWRKETFFSMLTNNPSVDFNVAIASTCLIVVSGALAGLFPALKASKVQPIEALRDE